jgi:hypothetical protein
MVFDSAIGVKEVMNDARTSGAKALCVVAVYGTAKAVP